MVQQNPFQPLADALRQRRDEILDRWVELVREQLLDAERLTFDQLRDHVPSVLGRMADMLEAGIPDRPGDGTDAHGIERCRQGYNIDELMTEYRLLRWAIIEEVEAALGRRMSREEDFAISAGVYAVMQQSVMAYVNFQREQLQAAVEAESKFVSYISHDLRNQLNHVSLLLELITSKLEDSVTAAEEMADIKHAREAIFQTVDAMEMLLKAARVRTGTATLRPERVDLNELIHCVARMFEREARSKGLTLALNVAADSYCQGDRRLLMLILHNLVGNAVKYSDNGTIRISARACDDGACTLRVADEGPGIAPEHQRRIFEEFVRGPTQGQPGVGLGLAIAARAAKLLGADLSVESSSGVGSVFRLNCPKTSD